jgi:riboflavin synthase
MFGGITETTGKVIEINKQDDCLYLQIKPCIVLDDIKIGDSIAVNGVCLTVTRVNQSIFSITAVPETLQLTNLKYLKIDDIVNLERSLSMQSRIGGHYVQGHVDFCGEMIELLEDGKLTKIAKISYPPSYANYLIKKGYITLDGMSITLIDVAANYFTVTFIPHTQAVSIVKHYQVGTKINVEVDMIGKYVEKLLRGASYD